MTAAMLYLTKLSKKCALISVDKVYVNVIPRNVRISEAPSHGKPVLIYDFRSTGAQAYIQLAREVLQQEGALARKTLARRRRRGINKSNCLRVWKHHDESSIYYHTRLQVAAGAGRVPVAWT
jgi:nitrogenase subunit NifH